MAFTNNMTKLINKINIRLGLESINLPEQFSKNKWAEKIIIPDTLETFSRYYPYKITYKITKDHPIKNGWIYIDEEFVDNYNILGIKDINWETFGNTSNFYSGIGTIDSITLTSNYSFEDLLSVSMATNYNSLFSNGLFPEFEPPNRFRLTGFYDNDITKKIGEFYIDLLVQHPNLATIPPTMMEIFENLAICDVAGYLYNNLKYYDDLETAYATLNLRLDTLQDKANQREEIISRIEESYVSAANHNQPLIMTI